MSSPQIDLEFDPEVFNDAYRPYYRNQSRYLHFYGGAGSGKSYFAAQKLVLRMLREPNHKFLLVRKVGRTVRNSMYALLQEVVRDWGLSELFIFRKSDLEIECPLTGGKFIYSGMDDPEKIKSVHGVTGVWIEEATELSPSEFNQLDLRMRGRNRAKYFQIILTYNPIHSEHWIRKRFHLEQDALTTLCHTTYKDNLRFLDEEYITSLQNLEKTDKAYYKVYALGEWATPEHLIFTNWKLWLKDSQPEVLHKSYGLDFGFNAPTAFGEIEWIGDRQLFTRQLIYEKKLKTPDILERFEELDIDKSDYIYADSSRPEQIEEIYQAGYNIHPAAKGPGSVLASIDYLKRYEIFLDPESEDAKKELQLYQWKLDKNETPLDEPVKHNDHFVDALRMGAYSYAREFLMGNEEALEGFLKSSSSKGKRGGRRRGKVDLTGY